jgi:hypothetical protein
MELAMKLQIKPGQTVAVLAAPADLELGLPAGNKLIKNPDQAEVVVAFVRDRAALGEAQTANALASARADRLTWFVYPKAGQLGTDLNRDLLAEALKGKGVRPVRQISVDAVWSALRFRPE